MRIVLLGVSLCLLASSRSRARAGADLETPLRAAYVDKGAVENASISLPGLPAPIHYLRAGPPESTRLVVLLHGMIFSASTFKWVGTLDALATAGCRVVALDLPSYSGQFASDDVKRRLLGDFLAQIGWHRKVVVVAASMGGTVGSP